MTQIRADLSGTVVAVHRMDTYSFSKQTVDSIALIAGLGVEGDAHLGATVQHRSRVKRDPSQPNLRQVHLITSELLDEVGAAGHEVPPGALGENITTAGIDLVGLPVGAMLRLGDTALVAITGLRNPCGQIEGLSTGLLKKMFADDSGIKVGRTGVMGVVVAGGLVRTGDPIEVRFPAGALAPLEKV
jgi:MOSC domain-containing protein YiiM